MTNYATKLASATDAATTFAHLTGARVTDNHAHYGDNYAATDEPWPVLTDATTGATIVDFLPNEDGVGYYVTIYRYSDDDMADCLCCIDELVTNAASAVRFLLNQHLG